MKKSLVAILACAMLMSVAGLGFLAGDQLPSAKATAVVADYTILDWFGAETPENPDPTVPIVVDDNLAWYPILSQQIKTSSQKDLFMDVSLECGLWTKTLVKSKDMVADTSTSIAGIKVRVMVDGTEAYPGDVIFARRSQELSATLQGQLDLVDSDGDGIVDFDELVVIAPEEISLLLNTMNANSFNFILDDVGVGVHTIEIQAAIDLGASAMAGKAEAKAMIGKGSVTIEEVRMLKGEEVVF